MGILIIGNVYDDDDMEEEELEWESEGESLNGFIVDDDDECVSEEGFDGVVLEEEEEEGGFDGEIGYVDVMVRLRRDKKFGEYKWDFEGEMLVVFGKDFEFCMRVVCVLYRF